MAIGDSQRLGPQRTQRSQRYDRENSCLRPSRFSAVKRFPLPYVPVLSLAAFCCGAIVFTLTGFAGIPTEIVYGSMSLVATPIDPRRPCSCTRTPLMTVE